jgi:hypothetical protein
MGNALIGARCKAFPTYPGMNLCIDLFTHTFNRVFLRPDVPYPQYIRILIKRECFDRCTYIRILIKREWFDRCRIKAFPTYPGMNLCIDLFTHTFNRVFLLPDDPFSDKFVSRGNVFDPVMSPWLYNLWKISGSEETNVHINWIKKTMWILTSAPKKQGGRGNWMQLLEGVIFVDWNHSILVKIWGDCTVAVEHCSD